MLAWNTLQQMKNTLSTDLMFKENRVNNELYINFAGNIPEKVTIEYIPILKDVSQIKSEHWQDILMRLTLAHTKIALGRIRTRFTQSGALWTGDGETILNEGKEELTTLREQLRVANDYFFPVD